MKSQKLAFVLCATLDMLEDDTLIFLKMGQRHSEETHAIPLNACDDSMQSQSRFRNLVVGQNFGGCCSNDNT